MRSKATLKQIANFEAPIEFIKGKPSMIPTRRIDSNKIYDKLGWKSTTSLEAGLKLAYDWYLKNKEEALEKAANIIIKNRINDGFVKFI